jgi:hypothetical protein
MQPKTAGEYAGGPEIGETESVMPSVDVPPADVSRPVTGSVGDLSVGTSQWAGPQGEPL